jgi:hypothetical protein
MRGHTAVFCVAMTLAGASAAPAQTPEARADSLERMVRRLQARIDSLEQVVARLVREGRDTAPAEDELAALRAAARGAAAEAPEAQQDPGSQASRTRSLQALNPEISITGDVVGNFVKPDAADYAVTAVPREFEFAFQAALDPYTHTKIFVARHEDFEIAGLPEHGHAEEEGAEGEEAHAEEHGFEIEEGYMYWVGLPGGFGAKLGKFRQEIGLYNRWHTHALLEVERPLASLLYLGEDGLIQTGASIMFPSFTAGPATQTLVGEVTLGNNDALFEGGNQLSYLSRFQSFWDLGATYVQLGATGVYGQNDDLELTTKLLGLDVAFRWTPPGRALYQDLNLKGELYLVERDEGVEHFTAKAGYGQVNYRLSRSWIVGARADYAELLEDGDRFYQVAPSITWWQSEWVRLRLQYNYLKPEGLPGNHTVLLQAVWAVGPHKHETY